MSLPSDRGSLADSDSPPDFEPPPPPPGEGEGAVTRVDLNGDSADMDTYKVLDSAELRRYQHEANYKFFVSPGRICADVVGLGEKRDS